MADERTNEEQNRIAPVALPAGSFEIRELGKALEQAVSVKDREKHPERISEAIAKTIKQPETLANLDSPAIPTGAKLVDQEIVYAEGSEPVTRKAVAFEGVDAKDGSEAAQMRYDERGGETVIVDADEPVGAPVSDDDAPATLAEQARERVEASTDTGKAGAGRK